MARRAQYSLKELLYWFAVWCGSLSVLAAIIPVRAGVVIIAIWFVGTSVTNKAFGYRAGYYYASFAGVVACFLAFSTTTGMSSRPPALPVALVLLSFLLLIGLVYGSFVWLVARGFDKLYTVLSRSK